MSATGRAGGGRCAGAGAAVLAGLLALAAPAAAQDSGSGGGTIETERLAPLAPPAAEAEAEGVVPRESRFKAVPFRGVTSPVAAALIEPVETRPAAGARLRQLDKMTGRTRTVEIAVGAEALIDRLRVRVETCRAPEDNAQHGTMAFLEIWDTKNPGADPAFSGWMFAESPALSALDHPRYDVWVLSCTIAEGAAASASE